jgi:hypothetical protein
MKPEIKEDGYSFHGHIDDKEHWHFTSREIGIIGLNTNKKDIAEARRSVFKLLGCKIQAIDAIANKVFNPETCHHGCVAEGDSAYCSCQWSNRKYYKG